MNSPAQAPSLGAGRERALLWLLALTQFTVIMDFMVVMPLGPQLMAAFDIGPAAFATMVSVYSWCAGLSGLFGATYIDRFDRKRLLLVVFALFALSNLGCALAPSYTILLLARAFAGITGGVLASVVMAIVADVIPFSRRGAAMGTVMTSFSLAAVAGVPAGVALGAHFGWSAPFWLLTGLSVLILASAWPLVPRLRGHLAAGPKPLSRILPELWITMVDPRHLNAFFVTALVMGSTMFVVPFISPLLVANHGVRPDQIAWLYMAGGAATLFTARAIGRWSDRSGKVRVFRIVALISLMPILLVTHLPSWPIVALAATFVFFMVPVSGRSIPMQAIQGAVPEPARRGAYLSINAALQSLATGTCAWIGGLLVSFGPGGRLVGYGWNGWIAAGLTVLAMVWISRVRVAPQAAA